MLYKFFFINSCYDNLNDNIEVMLNNIGGNSGNKYISIAICQLLLGHIPEKVDGISNLFNNNLETYSAEYINNNYTHVLFPMQDQLRKNISYYDNTPDNFLKINNFIRQIKLPIIVFGLGSNCFDPNNFSNIVNELHEEQIKFIKILSDKCKCISIRGHYTQKIFEDLNIKNYSVVGCPSFYLNNNKKITYKPLKKIVLTGCSINNFPFTNYPSLDYYFFLQDLNDGCLQCMGNGFFSTQLDAINNFFANKNFVYGSRVHSSIMALNNNVPAICLSKDSRAIEMCKLLKIPHIDSYLERFTTIFELYDLVVADLINTDFTYLYPEFVKFIEANDLKLV